MKKSAALYWLLLISGFSRAETVNFYLPEVPGFYERAGDGVSGRYVDLMRVVAAYAAVDFHFYFANIARADVQLSQAGNACTNRYLELNRSHPPGPRYLVEIGRTPIVMLARLNESEGMAGLALLPREEALVFGDEPARILRSRKVSATLINSSLEQALAMLSAGRARVLYVARTALDARDQSKFHIVGEFSSMVTYFSCSEKMSAELAARLSAAWQKVLPTVRR